MSEVKLESCPFCGREASDDMASLKCVGSGSSGNCYILTCNNEKLILDCGLPIKEIKKGLDWDIRGIRGMIISHAHL